jgi:hypothetical protein
VTFRHHLGERKAAAKPSEGEMQKESRTNFKSKLETAKEMQKV